MITRNKEWLCRRIWEKNKKKIRLEDVRKSVDGFLYELNHSLIRGERVEVRCWGIWSTWIRPPREYRNPFMNIPLVAPTTKLLRFVPSTLLKKAIKNSYKRRSK